MPIVTKKDYALIAIIGVVTGLLLLPVLVNIKLPFLRLSLASSLIIVLGLALLSVLALWTSYLISRTFPEFLQMAKYAAAGVMNTLIDIGLLNLLIILSGSAAGLLYILFKSLSFIVANINSYFWNKYWTFGSKRAIEMGEVGLFFTVSLIGFAINVGVASLIFNFIHITSISLGRWANISAIIASIVALAWNYIGYKSIVFKE